jgi:transcriptional regulator GlxA family with amidase domain
MSHSTSRNGSTTKNQEMSSRLDRIQDLEVLAEHARFDPATMAGLCPISLRQLERFIKSHFGKSPRYWLMQLRCRRARELLAKGYSNKAIVADLHFTSESHFCHCFKKLYGSPPQTFAPLYRRSVAVKQECYNIQNEQRMANSRLTL